MMEEQNVEKVFIEKTNGKNVDRKDFKAIMTFVRAGDTIIFEIIFRIVRNTRDLLNSISTLTEKSIEFVNLKEAIDTNTPHGRFMFTIFGVFAELERASWNANMRVSKLPRLKVSAKTVSLRQSTKRSPALSAFVGVPVDLLQLPRCGKLE